MKYIAILVLGIAIGHFGPVAFGKMTMKAGSVALQTGAKVIDTANQMVK